MCRSKSVSYFAHDPAHRLLPAVVAGDGGEEFTCGGCLVAGAGPRYRCGTPGCGFTIHDACALRFPRSLKSTLHRQHRLKRRAASAGADVCVAGGCDVCGEDVKGACYGCATCGVALHPLCARMPGVARGDGAGGAHPAEHEAWLVRASSSTATAADGGNGEKQAAPAPAGCAACGRLVGSWRYRCVTATCGAEFHPRCLLPAAEQCRGGVEGEEGSVGKGCCCGMLHYVTYCLAISSYGYHYRF